MILGAILWKLRTLLMMMTMIEMIKIPFPKITA
jgi:hypothetical protein